MSGFGKRFGIIAILAALPVVGCGSKQQPPPAEPEPAPAPPPEAAADAAPATPPEGAAPTPPPAKGNRGELIRKESGDAE